MDDILKTVNAVDEALKPEDDLLTLSTGVVLKSKQVPPLVLVKLMAAFPRPKAPIWINPVMGREMENPDDPEYIEQVKAWRLESSNVTLNALILLGTELVSIPKKMAGPFTDSWIDEYKLLGMPIFPDNKSWRYLTWVIFKAAPLNSDLEVIKGAVGRLSGVPEQKVQSAEEFPGS